MQIPAPPHPTHDLALLVDPDRVAVVRHLGGETRLLVSLPAGIRAAPSLHRRVLGGIMRAAPPRRVLVSVAAAAAKAPHAAAARAAARELQVPFGYGLVDLPDVAAQLAAARGTPDAIPGGQDAPRH